MDRSQGSPRGRMFVNLEGVAFLGRGLANEPHRHFSASVTIALEGKIRVRRDVDSPWIETSGLAAAPNASQQLDGSEALLLNLQIDPETTSYARLYERLWKDTDHVHFEANQLADLRSALTRAAEAPSPGLAMWKVTIDALGGPDVGPRSYDPRIAQVLALLKASMPEAPPAPQIGEQVGLSEGRLIHLFSEQVGVPLRRYVLWLRVRHVIFCLAVGKNLTDAAHEAGFADSPHLTRVFRSMFGLAPSQIFRSDGVSLAFEMPSLPLTGPHAVQDTERMAQLLKHISSNTPWARP